MRLRPELTSKLKRFQQYDFDSKTYLEKNYIEGEKAIIPIFLTQASQLYYVYDATQQQLNPDVIAYIESIAYYIPYQYSIVLQFHGISFTEAEKVQIVSLFHDYFGMKAHEKKVDLAYNQKQAEILLIVGLAILSFSYLLSNLAWSNFLREFASIIGTFSIWEFIDRMFLQHQNLKVANLNAGQLGVSTIEFVPTKELMDE